MIDVATVLAESEEHLVKLDMEMSESTINKLLIYAKDHMPVERLLELRVEWAVQSILAEYLIELEKLDPAGREKALAALKEEFEADEADKLQEDV